MDKISNQMQLQLMTLRKNLSLTEKIDRTLEQASAMIDVIEISPEAKELAKPDALRKILLESGAAPNRLSDLQYLKTLKTRP